MVQFHCRPQRSCGKVMFLHVSVILSTEGVWQTPPRQTPSTRADTPKQTPSLGRHPHWADLPPAATAVDGTHPIGMHSCSCKIFGQLFLMSMMCMFRLKACLHVPSPCRCLAPSKFNIVPMETLWQADWVQNPFSPSNGPSPFTQCKFDGHGDGDSTSKQALRIQGKGTDWICTDTNRGNYISFRSCFVTEIP